MVNEIDLANAEVELSTAKVYRAKGNGVLTDANDPASSLQNLGREGLEVADVQIDPTRNDPGLLRILYHAYDGRVVPVPSYMAPKRLAERFPQETYIPPQWRGKRVWFLDPQPMPDRPKFPCNLHADASAEVKAEIIAAGLTPGVCSKTNISSTYALEQHMHLKHKSAWQAVLKVRERQLADELRADSRAQVAASQAQAEAMLALAQALTPAATTGKEK